MCLRKSAGIGFLILFCPFLALLHFLGSTPESGVNSCSSIHLNVLACEGMTRQKLNNQLPFLL